MKRFLSAALVTSFLAATQVPGSIFSTAQVFDVASVQAAGGTITTTCTPINTPPAGNDASGKPTYDQPVTCTFTGPVGRRIVIGFPTRYTSLDWRTGDGPAPDYQWFYNGFTSAGWACANTFHGIMCDPTGAAGNSIQINFRAIGNCERANNIAAKDFAVNDPQSQAGWNTSWVSHIVTFPACQAPTPQCRDGIDNDGDGATDFPNDFSCSNADDNDEANTKSQCQDGIDNDQDGLVDFPQDSGCSSKQDNSETNVIVTLPACSDGIDNDGDGKTDFFDAGCYPNNIFNPVAYNPNDADESNAAVLCRWTRVNSQWVRQCQ